MSTWNTEEDTKPEYQVKASLVLEDSDKETWGLVRDTEGKFDREKDEGPIVGTWSKSPVDNCYHIFLETPITALVDKATLRTAELVKKRREGAPKPSRAVISLPAPDTTRAFDELRKNLKGE